MGMAMTLTPYLSDELKLLPLSPLKLSWTTIYNSQDMEATINK